MVAIINKQETGVNIRRIMDAKGISAKEVQQYLELGSVQSVYHWLNGLSMPSIDNLYALSGLFQLPIDSIVCGNRKPFISNVDNQRFEPNAKRLYWYYQKICQKCVA